MSEICQSETIQFISGSLLRPVSTAKISEANSPKTFMDGVITELEPNIEK